MRPLPGTRIRASAYAARAAVARLSAIVPSAMIALLRK